MSSTSSALSSRAVVAATGSMEAQPVVTTGLLGGVHDLLGRIPETAQDVRARRWACVVASPGDDDRLAYFASGWE